MVYRKAVICFVEYKDNLLLIQRGKEPGKGTWHPPGGGFDKADGNLYKTCKREVLEEGDVEVDLDTIDLLCDEPIIDVKCNTELWVFKARILEYQEPKYGSDAIDAKWVTRRDGWDYDMTDTMKEAYRRFDCFKKVEKVKSVGFDYNGTIPRDGEIGWKSANWVLKNLYGLPGISLDRFRETFGTPWQDFYVVNGVKRESIDIGVHQDMYSKKHTELALKELKLHPNAKETFEFLTKNKLQLGVLSSRNIKHLNMELERLGVLQFFNAVVGEDSIYEDGVYAKKKTDVLIKDMKIKDPSEVLYIGDMTQDVDNAREKGFISGVILGGWQSEDRLRAKKPDFVFRNYMDILNLFKKIYGQRVDAMNSEEEVIVEKGMREHREGKTTSLEDFEKEM